MRLNQVTAYCRDLETSIGFYRLLGLKLIVKSEDYARFELPDGDATFSLLTANDPIPTQNAPHLYFECDNVDAEVARLKAEGILFEQEPKMQTWLWYEAWFRDPFGNALCLYHAGDNRTHPPWRIES